MIDQPRSRPCNSSINCVRSLTASGLAQSEAAKINFEFALNKLPNGHPLTITTSLTIGSVRYRACISTNEFASFPLHCLRANSDLPLCSRWGYDGNGILLSSMIT